MLVASACNPSFSGGRDQEHHVQSQPWANSSLDHISKKPNTKKGWQNGSSIEHLCCKLEALSSNSSASKKSFKG
jgi:hypothetical protein